MVESTTLEEATEEKLAEADVIMAVGIGDPNVTNIVLGRAQFIRATSDRTVSAETNILRVKVSGDEEFDQLKERVKQAKGELDPNVK